jgi:hypothetical protein
MLFRMFMVCEKEHVHFLEHVFAFVPKEEGLSILKGVCSC